jgi:hypothetical protein
MFNDFSRALGPIHPPCLQYLSVPSSFNMAQAEPDLPTKAASLLRNLDVFPKVADEARARSASGGITTVAVALCILLLVVSEAQLYSKVRTDETLEVDVSRGGKVAVDFNITFDHLPCSLMSVDSMDISGAAAGTRSNFHNTSQCFTRINARRVLRPCLHCFAP